MACTRIDEDLLGVLDGTAHEALAAHVATCDACRDARHDAGRVGRLVAQAGADYVAPPDLGRRVEARLGEAAGRESHARLRTAKGPDLVVTPAAPRAPRKLRWKPILLGVAAVIGISTGVGVGIKAADWQKSPRAAASRAWHGKVGKVTRSGADKTGGLTATLLSGKSAPLAEGQEIKAGWHVVTDPRTRARIDLDDGTQIILDRATDLEIGQTPRTASIKDGAFVADVAHLDGAPTAKFTVPEGTINVLGTKLAVTAADGRSSVEVLRGVVEVLDASGAPVQVSAGQEAQLARGARVDVVPANDLAQRAAFEGELGVGLGHNEDTDGSVSGLGELRAKKPGNATEKDRAVRLTSHSAKIRVVGNVARTEVDEVFTNDTDDVLEGIYRFPLPPGAQIERLALEVDGKLVDGEFVDKAKAAAIWRGAIQNAAPKTPRPREEIIWVPGPWRDPALLEWQRGGRFELKIFPIPKRGSRRVVIAYTETIAPVAGVRRYTYPLPQSTSSDMKIDSFALDVQVTGADPKTGVKVRGYELTRSVAGGDGKPESERFAQTMTGFTPSGDLTLEYALPDRTTDASAYGFADGTVKTPEDGYVAIALRPKLPKWADTRPRDQVIVVDAGRAMFGERFKRARQLAVQVVQEMDRRDKVTVLACDVTCRAMPGGLKVPGSGAAHDADAFLAGVTPDGASDVVGAVRSAAGASGHDQARDLRVVVVSAGLASAGYHRMGAIAPEVSDALPDGRAEVVTVPIGADADVRLLEEVARGGGGVLVPYQPGERLETAALDVLNATYGTTLRDVTIELPAGLHDAAPTVLAPIRAGEERILLARVTGDHVQGDATLKGKVGGESFEAKYPLDVRVVTDAGNAFVPRLYAAARIADRERDGGEAAHDELVTLSRRHAVPSRFTSLLVLESEAMFQAFGIDRASRAPTWTGDLAASGTDVATLAPALAADDSLVANAYGDSQGFGHARATGGAGGSAGLGDPFHSAAGAPAPRPSPPPPPAKASNKPSDSLTGEDEERDKKEPFAQAPAATATASSRPDWGRSRPPPRITGGQFMKRVWFRKAQIFADGAPAVSSDKLAAARTALQASPDERGRHRDLARLLAVSGQLDELGDLLGKWGARDPLDADAIAARADLTARQGDREAALRILGGALAAPALSANDAAVLAATIASAHERAGKPEACVFRVAAAELRPADPDSVARAILCERARGRGVAADRWLAGLKNDAARAAVSAAAAKVDAANGKPDAAVNGDFVVTATWDAGADVDLDVSILDPNGTRAAWASRAKGVRVDGATSKSRESLALSSGTTGPFVVELVRASGSTASVSGSLAVRALGVTQTIPFTIPAGTSRVQLARMDVRMESSLVPVDDLGPDAFVTGLAPFDRSAAARALSAAARSVVSCVVENGPTGTGRALVTFSPSGAVSRVSIDAPFAGTPVGSCVTSRFRSVRLAGFSGSEVTVSKSFTVDGF
jgi:Vault protein inter-alpha-trypsin domain/FecR protein/von Willebrand factor type A domain